MFKSKPQSRHLSPPFWLEVRSSKWAIGCAAFGAAFTDGFLYGSIVPVLPFSLTERSHVPHEQVQFWISTLLTVFGIFLGAGAPVAGWFADRGSRSTPFFWGVILAIIATLVFALAKAPGLLVLGRVLQGLAASVIYTAGLALVSDAVDADEIGTWMGFVFSGNTFGLLISPFLAGLVYDHAGYYAVFGIIFGVFGLDLLLRAFMIEKRKAMKYLPEESKSSTATSPNVQDIRGARNTTSDQISGHEDDSSGSSENANRQEPQGSPYDPDERTHLLPHLSNPKKTTSWFSRHFPKFSILARSPRLIAAFYGCLTHEMLLGCLDSILPLFVKRTFHWTATGAGSIFLAITCPSLLTTIFGALADKFGARPVSLLGLILVTLNLGLMGIVNDDSMVSKVLLCVFLVLVGIGLNLVLAPLAADVFATVDNLVSTYPETFGEKGAYAQAYSLMTAAFGFGAALGPTLAGAMYEKTNWPITMGFLAILTALPIPGVFFYTGGGWRRGE